MEPINTVCLQALALQNLGVAQFPFSYPGFNQQAQNLNAWENKGLHGCDIIFRLLNWRLDVEFHFEPT